MGQGMCFARSRPRCNEQMAILMADSLPLGLIEIAWSIHSKSLLLLSHHGNNGV